MSSRILLTVTGKVTLQSGETVSGVTVNVLRDGYKLETFLATTTTNAQGVYKLNYEFEASDIIVDKFHYSTPVVVEIANEGISLCKEKANQNSLELTKDVVIPIKQNEYTLNKAEIKTALGLTGLSQSAFANKTLSDVEKNVIKRTISLSGTSITYGQTNDVYNLLKDAIFHSRLAFSKKRIATLHKNLKTIGYSIDEKAIALHLIDKSTQSYVKRVANLTSNFISQNAWEKLEEKALTSLLKDDRQALILMNEIERTANFVGKKRIAVKSNDSKAITTPARVQKIKKLDRNKLAESIKKFQTTYKLKTTGVLDSATYRRIKSVLASRGVKKSYRKRVLISQLAIPVGNLKLNVVDKVEVNKLQDCLCYLNYNIAQEEYEKGLYGATTHKAIEKYQKDNGLPITGKYDKSTRTHLTNKILRINPKALTLTFTHQIRGTVRDEYWKEMKGMRVTVYLVDLEGNQTYLNTRTTPRDGFFNIPIKAPKNIITGGLERNFTLYVKLSYAWQPDVVVATKYVHVKEKTTYVNFTGELDANGKLVFTGKYGGEDEYAKVKRELKKVLGRNYERYINRCFKTVSVVSREAKLTEDKVFNFVLSHRVYQNSLSCFMTNESTREVQDSMPLLSAEIIYAFLSQNSLGKYNHTIFLHESYYTNNKTNTLENVIGKIFDALMLMDEDLLDTTLESALTLLKVGRIVAIKKNEVLFALKVLKGRVAVRKKLEENQYRFLDILPQTCLTKKAKLNNIHPFIYIGMAYCETMKINNSFLSSINKAGWAVSQEETNQFKAIMLSSLVVRNNINALVKVTNKIKGHYIGQLSRWSDGDWNSDGCKGQLKDIEQQLKFYYPKEYFVSRVLRHYEKTTYSDLSKLKVLFNSMILDDGSKPRFDFYSISQVDSYTYKDTNGEFDKEYVKMLQRVRRMTDVPDVAVAMIDLGITNASKAYFMGKTLFVKTLSEHNTKIKQDDIVGAFNRVEQIYANILDSYTKMCDRVNVPAAMGKDAPTLRNIFGTLDYYGSEDDMSLLGAPAYFADLLRFLDKMPYGSGNGQNKRSLLDMLLTRRDDIQYIKLNSENAQGVVPYIDLVNYTLEKYIYTKKKLKADVKETYPISRQRTAIANVVYEYFNNSNETILSPYFSLPQIRNRAYLEFLGVPRYRIMEQMGCNLSEVAAQYFGMSQKEYQSFIAIQNEDKALLEPSTSKGIPVTTLMKELDMSYAELMEMLNYMGYTFLQHDTDNADITQQVVHRMDNNTHPYTKGEVFMIRRLQKYTGFTTRELFRLIFHPLVGQSRFMLKGGRETLLIELYAFKRIMSQLNLSVIDTMELLGGECENGVTRDNVALAALRRHIKDYDIFSEVYGSASADSPSHFLDFLTFVDLVKSCGFSAKDLKNLVAIDNVSLKVNYEKMVTAAEDIKQTSKELSDKKERMNYVWESLSSLFEMNKVWISMIVQNESAQNAVCEASIPYYILLNKIAYCKKILKLTDIQFKFLFENSGKQDTPDMLNPSKKWTCHQIANMVRIVQLDNKLMPEEDGSKTYLEIIQKAKSKEEIYTFLDQITGLQTTGLASDAGLSYFRSANGFLHVGELLDILDTLSCTAQELNKWAVIESYESELSKADYLRERIAGKYTIKKAEEWLRQIENPIREMKRDVLVDLILNTHLSATSEQFTSKAAMTAYFLMDVEMNSEQDTSEIRHALSSIQMFVQRCMLNLENGVNITSTSKNDVTSETSWSQWNWMKNYRVWEANRKIFLFPENYLEPELRDGQSPFFKEFLSELQQNEATTENVEEALLNYLHKLDEIAKLEVCGVYRQQDDLNSSIEGYELDIFHVIARTKDAPHVYYYRTYDVNYKQWSPWEKIEIDLDGEQILPVVYNRRFYIFWLQFQKKELKPKKLPETSLEGDGKIHDIVEYYEIQLLWTQRKKNGWTSKKISKKKLIHPWARPLNSYTMKPYLNPTTNKLMLDIYLTTSPEFNNKYMNFDLYGDYKDTCHLTPKSYNSYSFYPWLSSSFVFDGDVTEVLFKDLSGSLAFVQQHFGEEAAEMKPLLEGRSQIQIPHKMHMKGNRMCNNTAKYIDVIVSESCSEYIIDKTLIYQNTSQLIIPFKRINDSVHSHILLSNAQSPFEYVSTLQREEQWGYMDKDLSFYQDGDKVFAIHTINPSHSTTVFFNKCKYSFSPFYHPYVNLFISELNKNGIDGLYDKYLQVAPEKLYSGSYKKMNFAKDYVPTEYVNGDFPSEIIDFAPESSYGVYNWELFFHIPLTIAIRLMQNQKFEDAMKWFHYIFNPIDYVKDGTKAPECFWITYPFRENAKSMGVALDGKEKDENRIEEILRNINTNTDQLKAWRNNPFKPHIVAQQRTTAYQRQVVMKYIENLIAWGDMLFRQDTMESINEATMLYLLANEILGLRPNKVENPYKVTNELCYKDIRSSLDSFGNTTVGNGLPVYLEDNLSIDTARYSTKTSNTMPKLDIGYFSMPSNDSMETCWNTVEDRLYKIHNSLNINGVFRKLALYEPPIDPAMLVRAAAAGISIADAVNDMQGQSRCYKFRSVVQKASEFCADVKGLGEKLLSIHEKKDAEMLSVLRQEQEMMILNASTEIKKQQINEAKEYIKQLQYNKASAEIRYNFYSTIESMSEKEIEALRLSLNANKLEDAAATLRMTASALSAIPSISVGVAGFGGSPTFNTQVFDGSKLTLGLDMIAQQKQGLAAQLNRSTAILNTKASYERRQAEWQLQAETSKKDVDALERQLVAAEIRLEIAEKDLENHELQIENSKAMYEAMTSKFSTEKLYNWMLEQTSKIYFEAYSIAYKLARIAEGCYKYELGVDSISIIKPDCWDSLREGLLSGDRLLVKIHQLEQAYLENNTRCMELTKHVSLAEFDPSALMKLIAGNSKDGKGSCEVYLPDSLFDMDYNTHYMRRIKSVSISIPCVAGPSTNINCTLTLQEGAYYLKDGIKRQSPTQEGLSSIATSTGINDSGLFELNFNDERYLPFEGYGVDSKWTLSMPKDTNYFDRSSISDVILNICYTAKDAGQKIGKTGDKPNYGRLLNLKAEFPNEWYAFKHQEGKNAVFEAVVNSDRFAKYLRKEILEVNSVYAKVGDDVSELTNGCDSARFANGVLTLSMKKNDLMNTDNIYVVIKPK